MDTTQETESIRTLIKQIETGNIVLPEFQRDFVWEVGKTHDLFDSLVKDIFIGSLIYGIPSFEITVREIDARPRKGKGSRAKLRLTSFSKQEIEKRRASASFRLVLDGQQRVTSLYRALKGTDTVWFVSKYPKEAGLDFEKSSCEQLLNEFAGQEDPEKLCVRLSDVYDIMENSYFEKEIWSKFFQDLKVIQGKTESEIEEFFRRFLTLSRKLQDILKGEKLLSYYLLNTTTEKFSLFFERSNSKGLQLNFTDILAAKLYDGFNLRKQIETFEDQYPNYALNREILVRAIAYVVSERGQIDRNYILNNLTAQDFNKHWEEVTTLYRLSIDFLFKNSFIVSQAWMPYDNMLLPVMFFLKSLGGDFSQMSEEQLRFFKAWYWCAIFAERYSASTNEVTTLDARVLEELAGHKEGIKTDKAYVAKFKILIDAAEEVGLVNKKGSVLYTGILNLVNYDAGGLTDWMNSSKLLLSSKLEDHHIFPKDYLKKSAKEDEDVDETADSVANRTLIPKITNIKIGAKAPSEYLKELKKHNSHLSVSLSLHKVPDLVDEGLYDKDYSEFVKERSQLIFRAIQKHVLEQRDYLASLAKVEEKPKV